MWLELCLSFFINWFSGFDVNHRNHSDMNETAFDFQVGDWFKDLSPETIDYLHHCYHEDRYNQNSSNIDDCWSFSPSCQLDTEHHIYYVPMSMHKGHYYIVTFSINYHVLDIHNTWLHAS